MSKEYKKLYHTDNGCILCEDHLGMTAKYTRRDISGQRIQRVTLSNVKYFELQGLQCVCERCNCECATI